ncbi:diaminopropionate ammonia-lyase [Afifella pfennigii]|uniref:diaminopropionate ammonia-lyase n=1 Tax=Afifella pfennigii TaxID=209897 RepID=UPI00047C706E|nr:diaminopropionate ammonia-lyase [Afifella pfennigii]
MQLVSNRSAKLGTPLSEKERNIVGAPGAAEVRRFLPAFPIYAPTPLVALPGLADKLGVGAIHLKDEGQRYGLSSFKALGGAYAVARLVHEHVQKRLGRKVAPAELLTDEAKAIAAELTVSCATDGNHGRSVAAGAQMFGCRCVIFLHAHVSEGREKAIAAFGAEIRRTPGNYDQSIVEANETAAAEGWVTVSDFSWEGYRDIPGTVMQGYSIMMAEIDEAAPQGFTHVFVQGGVGGLAAVVAGHFFDRFGSNRPCLVVVEPTRATCLQASAARDERTAIEAGESTVMAMLECYEPSLAAWEILEKCADFYLDIPDEAAVAALKTLAGGEGGDPSLTIGESGTAGLAGLQAALADEAMRAALGLDKSSRVLLFGTEGATDPELYQKLLNS